MFYLQPPVMIFEVLIMDQWGHIIFRVGQRGYCNIHRDWDKSSSLREERGLDWDNQGPEHVQACPPRKGLPVQWLSHAQSVGQCIGVNSRRMRHKSCYELGSHVTMIAIATCGPGGKASYLKVNPLCVCVCVCVWVCVGACIVRACTCVCVCLWFYVYM